MDLLYNICNLMDAPKGADEDKVRQVLVPAALNFLRAGGTLSLQDYALLSPLSRQAFVAAGELHRREQAVAIGMAAQGALGAAAVLSDVDGGQTVKELACDAVAGQTATHLTRKGKA